MSPLEAVAEGMMIASFQLSKFDWPVLLRKGVVAGSTTENDIQGMMKEASKKWCKLGSGWCLRYLSEKHSDLFLDLLLVESWNDPKKPLIDGWLWHSYFLVRGVDGVWYAGSPGNYDAKRGVNRLVNIIADQDLEKVLKKVQIIEGGDWPRSKSVMDINEDFDQDIKLFPNENMDVLECLCISRKSEIDVVFREKIGLI